jgi:hypothetical protein
MLEPYITANTVHVHVMDLLRQRLLAVLAQQLLPERLLAVLEPCMSLQCIAV